MRAEMAEQPQVLRRLAERFDEIADQVRTVAEDIDGGLKGVAFLARGSSDNSALLGRYAIEEQTGLPTSLVAPSLVTVYRKRPELYRGWLLIALSQSGRTPEIVDIAARYAECGASVVAVTNNPDSALARAARLHVDLGAGPELAVPATKTVTSQMLAILAITAGLARSSATGGSASTDAVTTASPGAHATAVASAHTDTAAGASAHTHARAGASTGTTASEPGPVVAGGFAAADARRLADQVAEILADSDSIERAVGSLAGHRRLAVVGRGACYPAALETALKLQETLGLMAHGFSSADFRHGPIAVCGPDAPAVLLAGSGPADDDTRALRSELADRAAHVVEFGTGAKADATWSSLGTMAECILATVRGQQFALATATYLGIDPDQPAGLNKVTLTH
jgi:glucosamine--fructose-6-phosphate aminotransferase (isomerizing)